MPAKMQSSKHGRLGPRISEQDVQIRNWRGGGGLCGAIFMCNRRTWKECLGQCLFGLPIGKKVLVQQVIPGMKLFLFEFERRQLWGVFEATSYGEMDIIPNAYSGGSFPCQVRVKVPETCVALQEEEFREAIKENYLSYSKFHIDLSAKQVWHLTSLFERKYVGMMDSNRLEYDDNWYHADGCISKRGSPLLLTNDATAFYPKELSQLCRYSSGRQIGNGAFVFSVEEGMDPFLKKAGSIISHEKGLLVPFSNRALEIVQNTVSSLTGEVGNGFDFPNATSLSLCGSNEHSVVEDVGTGDMIIPCKNVLRLHADRPSAKSVWTRISGCPKASVDLESGQAKKSPSVNPVLTSPRVCTISELDVVDDCSIEDLARADVSEAFVKDFVVGFKRRRAGSSSASTNVHETATKRRRKLRRPSFNEVADEGLVEQAEDNASIPSADGSFASSIGGARVDAGDIYMPAKFSFGFEDKVCLSHDISCSTALELGERIVRVDAFGSNQGNGFLQAGQDICRASTIDLNLPVEASNEKDQASPDEEFATVTGFLDTDEQSCDLQQAHVSTSRASTLSLAPCTPAKDFLDRWHSCSEQCDDGKGSSDLEQDMPLRLELGNGAQLLDTELQAGEHVAEGSCKKEPAMLDESANRNQGIDSNTISLHCTPGSNLPNQVDLKSFLNGVQVSGIKLQFGESGESACLILQLGDARGSTSNVDSQEHRGATQGPL